MTWFINGVEFTGTVVNVPFVDSGSGYDNTSLDTAVTLASSNTLFLLDPGKYQAAFTNYIIVTGKTLYFRGLGANPSDTVIFSSFYGNYFSGNGSHLYYENLEIEVFKGWQRGFNANTGSTGIVTANKCRVVADPAATPPSYHYSAGAGGGSYGTMNAVFHFTNCYLTQGYSHFVNINLSNVSLDKVEFDASPTSTYPGGSLSGDYVTTPTLEYGSTYGELTIVDTDPLAVTTNACSDITATSFTANGEVTNEGIGTTIERGFVCLIGVGTPTIDNFNFIFTEPSGLGVFSNSFAELAGASYLSVRAYATSEYGTVYGAIVYVSMALTVTTNPCTSSYSTINASATISPTSFGIDKIGFCYVVDDGSVTDPTKSNSYVEDLGSFMGTSSFSRSIGVTLNTKYLVRSFVECSGIIYYGNTVSISTVVIVSVEVTPALPELEVGETVQLTCTATYSDGTTEDITSQCSFSSQDLAVFTFSYGGSTEFLIDYSTGNTIASVSSGGLITGLAGGIAKTFVYVFNFKDSVQLTVVQPTEGHVDVGGIWDGGLAPGTVIPDLEGIEIEMDASMYVRGSQQALLYGLFDDSPQTISLLNALDATWTSSNPDVATVDSKGLIVGVAYGVTFIKVSYTTTESPITTYTTMAMLRVENQEGLFVEGQDYQYIELTPDPNQTFRVTISTAIDRQIDLDIFLSWNEETACWYMRISDPVSQEYYIDSVPLLSGKQSMINILKQYSYLNIGSCYIVDVSGKNTGKPNTTDLGIDFKMYWGYTE